MRGIKDICQLVVIILIIFAIVGCDGSKTPSASAAARTAEGILNAMFSGEVKRALDYVCIDKESGIVFMVAVQVDWRDADYQVLSNDGTTAKVLVKGRVVAAANDVQSIFSQLSRELPRVGVGAQVNIYLDSLTLINDSGRWCVPESSIKAFWQYLADLISKEITSQ